MSNLWFLPIGFLAGAYGTLIGAGGGFILVPIFLFLSPTESPAVITAASLAIIFINSVSGTVAYARMRRISYKTGLLFAAFTIPGAVAGSYLTGFISGRLFGMIFGALLIVAAIFISINRGRKTDSNQKTGSPRPSPRQYPVFDRVTDREGHAYELSFNARLGAGLSLLVGLFSSFVGIGGGLIHVPVLTYLLGFPIHVATATSHFILMFTALAGVLTHIVDGTFPSDFPRLLILAAGAVVGAQLGALVSHRISAPWIAVGLAVALGLVGVRLVVTSL
jgi:uncharacterized membrane protein YfcA